MTMVLKESEKPVAPEWTETPRRRDPCDLIAVHIKRTRKNPATEKPPPEKLPPEYYLP